MQEQTIGSYRITFEDEARAGFDYLNRIDRTESKVFFTYAYEHREAPFQDDNRRRYVLSYENGTYIIDRK